MTPRFRTHGDPPFRVAVLHGGPGGAGEVRPLAAELVAHEISALEPLQTGPSVTAQVAELAQLLRKEAAAPTVLIGWSWGAWLAGFCAVRHPELVSKLILIGCPPFDASDHAKIKQARAARLTPDQATELAALKSAPLTPQNAARFIQLCETSDGVDIEHSTAPVEIDFALNAAVWPEAQQMRETGALLGLFATLSCPIHVIHGRQDAHPHQGVEDPLRALHPNLRVSLLERCGHKPWIERQARAAFMDALLADLRQTV